MTPADPEVSFAVWIAPENGFQVSYSLPLFHEIDFEVNEGYRRIPHGGIEVGGLLYGTVNAKSLRIEAFRPIDCEHASGPSFNLSDRDLATLADSILAAPSDEGLAGLMPLGWFIAHTRSPLLMTPRELALFERFFPEPRRLTILVKPERFKPTRFAFLLRDLTGRVNPEGEASAVILPLPGRAGKTVPEPITPLPSPTADKKQPIEIRQTTEIKTVPELPAEIPAPPPLPPPPPEAPADEARTAPPSRLPQQRFEAPRSRLGLVLAILAFAALLGCAAGYLAYLQLPPPVIALRMQKLSNGLLVLWDPSQTQSSRFAVIRVNDSPPVLLTEEQKASGIAQVPLTGDTVKVEILAQHWARDSRGIIRFVRAQHRQSPQATSIVPQ